LFWSSHGLALLLTSVLRSVVHWHYHRTTAEVMAEPHSLGQLAIWGLIVVVLCPLTEEMFFRGLLLEWFQQRLARLPSALVTATIFALWHLRFLEYPGIRGWIATAVIGAIGLLCALWAQRARSLCAPVAAHATYNAALTFVVFLRNDLIGGLSPWPSRNVPTCYSLIPRNFTTSRVLHSITGTIRNGDHELYPSPGCDYLRVQPSYLDCSDLPTRRIHDCSYPSADRLRRPPTLKDPMARNEPDPGTWLQ
jgi:Type II CAAX prenyl endopeptidase Rce1-like